MPPALYDSLWPDTSCCKQTHRSVCTADTKHIPIHFFFPQAEHIPFLHMGTRILNQLREELLSKAECYLHQALSGTSAVCYFRVPVAPTISSVKKGSHFSLDDAQKRLSLGGKMVITQDLAAFTQVSSWGRNRQGGKDEEKKSIV